jgi:hypothetical protein
MALYALSALLLSLLVTDATKVFATQPEPQCVCAECGTPCGSGHTATCSARPKS